MRKLNFSFLNYSDTDVIKSETAQNCGDTTVVATIWKVLKCW